MAVDVESLIAAEGGLESVLENAEEQLRGGSADGQVYCWGVNRMHHLHVPTDEAGQVVVHPSAMPGLTDATQVVIGWFAQCAQRQSGGWVCWGRNANGAVGVGSRDRMVTRPTPLPW